MIVTLIQILLVVALFGLLVLFITAAYRGKLPVFKRFGLGAVIGFATDFGDTLGIGSFAPTTALFKATKWVDSDKKLPGTLNTAHAIPVLVEALFFITAVKVELTTLLPMTAAAVAGAAVGSRLTKNWHVPTVQRVLGVALIIAIAIMIIRMVTNPGADISENIHGLHGWLLFVGIIFNFILGNLMTMGLGNYSPELIFFSVVGVNPAIAFPVMMLDAALIMVTSAREFVRTERIEWRGFAGILIGGVLGVIAAATLFSSLDITLLKYLVIAVGLWTAFTLLRDSRSKKQL